MSVNYGIVRQRLLQEEEEWGDMETNVDDRMAPNGEGTLQVPPIPEEVEKNGAAAVSQGKRTMQQQSTILQQRTDCPSNYNSQTFVGPGCSCNPVSSMGTGLCQPGFVCAEPWVGEMLQGYQNQASLSVATGNATGNTGGKQDEEFPEFSCFPCFYGQFCPPGSAMPAMDSNKIQAYVMLVL